MLRADRRWRAASTMSQQFMENLEATGAFRTASATGRRAGSRDEISGRPQVASADDSDRTASEPAPAAPPRPRWGAPPMTLLRSASSSRSALWIIPLALGIVANIAVYLLVVYPLAVKSAGAEDRAAAAGAGAAGGRARFRAARAIWSPGKTRADQELSTFYDKVLPADLPSARRLTYATLPSWRAGATSRFIDRRLEVEPPRRDSRLGVLKIAYAVAGRLREPAPVHLRARERAGVRDHRRRHARPDRSGQAAHADAELSTYYRLAANGN